MATVGKRVYYTGRVQGVGFRYTTRELVADLAVAGTVRNCADGGVELVVEGAAEAVVSFLDAVAGQFVDHIHRAEVTDVVPTGRTGFTILH